MRPFFDVFPNLAQKETRTVIIANHDDLPDGQYAFVEFFCDDPDCDCQRVMMSVISSEHPDIVFATISYGWKSEAFYRKWSRSGPGESYKGPFLDPLNRQSEYAPIFLDLFKHMTLDPSYVDRIHRHYDMFKKTVTQTGPLGIGSKPGKKTRRWKVKRS